MHIANVARCIVYCKITSVAITKKNQVLCYLLCCDETKDSRYIILCHVKVYIKKCFRKQECKSYMDR